MPTTVQMNTRIDPELKAMGDQALAHLGYTPTQAVKSLWRFAIANRDNPQRAAEVLSLDDGDGAARVQERLAALERGRSLCRALDAEPNELDALEYKDLRDLMYDELLTEME